MIRMPECEHCFDEIKYVMDNKEIVRPFAMNCGWCGKEVDCRLNCDNCGKCEYQDIEKKNVFVEVTTCPNCLRKPKCDIFKHFGTDTFYCEHALKAGEADGKGGAV